MSSNIAHGAFLKRKMIISSYIALMKKYAFSIIR